LADAVAQRRGPARLVQLRRADAAILQVRDPAGGVAHEHHRRAVALHPELPLRARRHGRGRLARGLGDQCRAFAPDAHVPAGTEPVEARVRISASAGPPTRRSSKLISQRAMSSTLLKSELEPSAVSWSGVLRQPWPARSYPMARLGIVSARSSRKCVVAIPSGRKIRSSV